MYEREGHADLKVRPVPNALSDRHVLAMGAVFAVVLGASFPRPVLNEPDQPAWRARYSQPSYPTATYTYVDSGPVDVVPGPLWNARYGFSPPYDMHPAVFQRAWPQDVPPPRELDLPDLPTARELTRTEDSPPPTAQSAEAPVRSDGPAEVDQPPEEASAAYRNKPSPTPTNAPNNTAPSSQT